MRIQTTPAGAMPVVVGATPTQSYPSGPVFAAYRLPTARLLGAREAGVCLEGEPDGGATPPAGGKPPTPPAGGTPPAPPAPPATGDPDGLGDAGKLAIQAERAKAKAAEDRAKAVEKELAELKAAGQSESEKAIAAAKKAGGDEVLARVHAQVRRSEVKAALAAAGINATVLDLATKADEFAALKVTDEGEVEGLAAAVEAFKKSKADLFKPAPSSGTADGGNSGNGKTITRDQIKELAKTPGALTAALEKGELNSVLKQ